MILAGVDAGNTVLAVSDMSNSGDHEHYLPVVGLPMVAPVGLRRFSSPSSPSSPSSACTSEDEEGDWSTDIIGASTFPRVFPLLVTTMVKYYVISKPSKSRDTRQK